MARIQELVKQGRMQKQVALDFGVSESLVSRVMTKTVHDFAR